jgi:DNA-binding GntR family transcriptional regulator
VFSLFSLYHLPVLRVISNCVCCYFIMGDSSTSFALNTSFAISDGNAGASDSHLPVTADRVRQKLLALILNGEIAAGTRLDQRQLAKRLETTTAPLREAFSALENEGLLVRQQGLGVFCRVYTVPEIEEMVEIRGVLEALAARRATAHITTPEIAELRAIAMQLSQPIKPDGVSGFLQCHVGFHKRIIQISRSPRLVALLEFHHFIDVVLANIAPQFWEIEPHDHLGLVSALESGNAEWAEQAMRNHIAPTYQKRFAALRARFGEGPIFSRQMAQS